MADSQRIEDLRRRVQKDPASIAFAQLAEECRRAGQYEESIEVCRAGLHIHPGYLSARVTLGRALIELNKLAEAQEELDFVLKNAPDNLAAIRGLADIHHRNGSLIDALKHYRAALALAKNDPDLQQTVEELERAVEPPKPVASADGLSLAQIESEFLQFTPPPAPPPKPAPPPSAAPEPPAAPAMVWSEPAASGEDSAELDLAMKTILALEHWLDAIHVTRAQPRP
jgi:tetratricopeptide (TPR) repeat protein